VVAVSADDRCDRCDRRISANRIAASDQDGHALRQAEQAANAVACPNRDRDDAHDADDQDRAERHDRGGTDRSAEHHDRAFEDKFRTDTDAGIKAWTWLPRPADRYAD